MKELIIVSKTHLDLGFTNYASVVKEKYLTQYIPSAVRLAEELNKDGKKRFVWTTGSWILKEAIESDNQELRESVVRAIEKGDIAPHGLPFTTHTELLDSDLAEYGLSIVDKLDKISGRKTIAAKMTDVPGHTGAIVPFLAKQGIKLLHIGVNGASTVPEVPECFLWKFGGAEVIVVYSADYGGVFKCDYIDDILYFDHTLDNRGTKSAEAVLAKVKELEGKYPDYSVRAGRIDDIAEKLWAVKDKLPIVTDEIGDTWIHGAATDPFKVGAYRRLCALKSKWLADGSMTKDSEEYQGFVDELLCIPEHTWGMDVKVNFSDMENYLKKDFDKARKRDIVKIKNPLVYFPNSTNYFFHQLFSLEKDKLSYSKFERSWEEQREYIFKAVEHLSGEHRAEALLCLESLCPTHFEYSGAKYTFGSEIAVGNNKIIVNEKGGITLVIDGKTVLDGKDKAVLEYRSYNSTDYDYWVKNYTRNYAQTWAWSLGDFARPGLKKFDKKYPHGLFEYKAVDAVCTENGVIVKLDCDECLKTQLGAPNNVYVEYSLDEEGLNAKLLWLEKDATRTTESLAMRFYPVEGNDGIKYVKIGSEVCPQEIVSKGGRKLLAVENASFKADGVEYKAECLEAPLMATDGGNILHIDNVLAEKGKEGLTYILHDNVWGTNFPLWYEQSAVFNFSIKKK